MSPLSARRWLVAGLSATTAFCTLALRLRAAEPAGAQIELWVPIVVTTFIVAAILALLVGLVMPAVLRGNFLAACALVALSVAAFDLRLLVTAIGVSPDYFAMAETDPAGVAPLRPPYATQLPYVSVLALRTGGAEPRIALRDAAGRDLPPYGGDLAMDGVAHRLNFLAPASPFTLSVQGSVRVQAVTAYDGTVRTAGKFIHFWWLFAVAAVAAAFASLALANAARLLQRPAGGGMSVSHWAVLALVAYVGITLPYFDTYAGGADSSGYLNSARMLAHGHLSLPLPRPADAGMLHAARFVPLGFTLGAGLPARLVPTYPLGLSLLFSGPMRILPERFAISFVILAHLVAGLFLMYQLARRLTSSEAWAFALAAALALSPVYLFMGLQPMSDVPALVWVLASVVAAQQGRPTWSGAAFAVAVMIRPSNVLALPAVLVARSWRPKELLHALAGALPFALFEAWSNQRLYGHAWTTGYGDTSTLFGRQWLEPTFAHYAHWFPIEFTPLIVFALAAPFLRRLSVATRRLIVVWALPLLFFYAAYYCTHQTWWYLRFLLPTVPIWLCAAALALPPRLPRPMLGALALFAGIWLFVADARLGTLNSAAGNAAYEQSSEWLAAHAPADAVVISSVTSGALMHYSQLHFAFVGAPSETRDVAEYAAAKHHALYADFFPFEDKYFPPANPSGRWRVAHQAGSIVIWLWEPEKTRSPG